MAELLRRNRTTWDQLEICPTIQLKFGVKRQSLELARLSSRRGRLRFRSEQISLRGRWDNTAGFGSRLRLTLTNNSDASLRVTRLIFPTENGIDAFLSSYRPEDLSFLRNGYQSWSTARSYRLAEKPIRPWLTMISLASSNMANLPSNKRGRFASDMYAVINNLATGDSFLVGQADPFRQFFYIRLYHYRRPEQKTHFELVYDFGRKLLPPGESIELDAILMAKGETGTLEARYFDYIKRRMRVKTPRRRLTGWSSWYYYYNRVEPKDILENLRVISDRGLALDVVQIDDGYQSRVGDWLQLREPFQGRMAELAGAIRDAGFRPGIWIAPFVAERGCGLLHEHPEYVLRNEYGRPIVAGYNLLWRGRVYYGLDITNYRLEEYLRRIIRTFVDGWGFDVLKCDFLFGACLRGGTHNDLRLSRAEVMRRGMQIIREEAGEEAHLIGCGMPLSAGIGLVEAMRIGTDTGPYWSKAAGKFLNTAAMVGVRNSVRNILVRARMHKRLWLNDPDCIMVRRAQTRLDPGERMTQINAAILAGGPLYFSDDLGRLTPDRLGEVDKIISLNRECFAGESMAIDVMEAEVPCLFYNTAGLLGVFNPNSRRQDRAVRLHRLPTSAVITALEDVWSEERIPVSPGGELVIPRMAAHSSRLFRLVPARRNR